MEKLLSPQEAADLLGVKTCTVYTWAYRRQIPSQKVGCLLRFSPGRCLELRYRSQSRSPRDQRLGKMKRLKFRLGARGYGTAPIVPMPPRPKRMHWKTYMKLVGKLQALAGAYWQTTWEYMHRRFGHGGVK